MNHTDIVNFVRGKSISPKDSELGFDVRGLLYAKVNEDFIQVSSVSRYQRENSQGQKYSMLFKRELLSGRHRLEQILNEDVRELYYVGDLVEKMFEGVIDDKQ